MPCSPTSSKHLGKWVRRTNPPQKQGCPCSRGGLVIYLYAEVIIAWASERVLIIGGGLAGLAATMALAPRGFQVMLLEACNRLGGRTSSFRHRQRGERIAIITEDGKESQQTAENIALLQLRIMIATKAQATT
jgi:NADPH-dependent 2,4-dienoyl-CoA reductase/sulfur reductase-like enzyme